MLIKKLFVNLTNENKVGFFKRTALTLFLFSTTPLILQPNLTTIMILKPGFKSDKQTIFKDKLTPPKLTFLSTLISLPIYIWIIPLLAALFAYIIPTFLIPKRESPYLKQTCSPTSYMFGFQGVNRALVCGGSGRGGASNRLQLL